MKPLDLSLVTTDLLIKELVRRLGIEIFVAMDAQAAGQYFEADIEFTMEEDVKG